MKIVKTGALLAGMLLCLGAQAELVNDQAAIEATNIRVKADASGKGHVVTKACHECPSMRLDLMPASVISVNGKSVSAGKNISRNWPDGVVIYDVKKNEVVKLKLMK